MVVWGKSGNGKTSFVLQLCKELTRYGKVAYDSLEEGSSLTMQKRPGACWKWQMWAESLCAAERKLCRA